MFFQAAPNDVGSPISRYVLTRNISAIQIVPDAFGKLRLGTMSRLPEGAELTVCGEGFDERTAKVCWEGGYYYIFLEDVENDIRSDLKAMGAAG